MNTYLEAACDQTQHPVQRLEGGQFGDGKDPC